MRVFVYGTLKADGHANGLMRDAGAKFICETRTSEDYRLFDVGGFPGLRRTNGDSPGGVSGEVWDVPPGNFRDLDYYEGIENGLFRKEEIDLFDGSSAMAYIFNRAIDTRRQIKSGVWENG